MPPIDDPGRTDDRDRIDNPGRMDDSGRTDDLRRPGCGAAPNTHTRRGFLQLMAASLALAGTAGCRWPREKILPFAHREPDHDPGVTLRYATAMEVGDAVQGLLVTSYDGRPIKVEGNPAHPINLGSADLFAQASILDLYDPDRSRRVTRAGTAERFADDWDGFRDFWVEHGGELGRNGGSGLRVLAQPSSSATLAALRARFRQVYPQAWWHEWEPLTHEAEQAGALLAFGRPYRAHPRPAQADVIVALDSDFLFDHPEAVKLAREFAAGRRGDDGRMNRLYAVESAWSITGVAADHRYAVPPSAVPVVAARLAAEIGRALAGLEEPGLAAALDVFGRFASLSYDAPFVEPIAADLVAHRGRCLLLAGPRQPAEVHALVHALNLLLGNRDRTVAYTLPAEEAPVAGASDPRLPARHASLGLLAGAIRAGEVETLVILGGNPAYDAPCDLDFGALLATVPTVVRLATHEDETTLARARAGVDRGTWHLPMAHYLESWGDVRAWDGTFSVIQPLIEPLYDGKTAAETLAIVVGEALDRGHDLVRRSAAAALGLIGPDDPAFEHAWRGLLETGVLSGSARPAEAAALDASSFTRALGSYRPTPAGSGLEVLFAADGSVWDGRFANNGWLQELPDALTKMTWDNAAVMGPETAARIGVKADDLVSLRLGGRALTLATYVLPGVAAGTVVLPLGYGRTLPERVARGAGFDTYRLRAGDAPWFALGLEARRANGTYRLACTQLHHVLDRTGRQAMDERAPNLLRQATLDEYRAHPDFAEHLVHPPESAPLWKEHAYEGYRWGMTIDLGACIGCNACVVACYAENNIPVVGKSRVIKGRIMHWIRVDRYFRDDSTAPGAAFQPLACVHCETAPCEEVCPVGATVHDHDGLNVMVYNRCIGTRYCSNNCPYKVRRFNFFNYRKGLTPTEKMAMNPDVTVRSRGVMEKCTYCLQRIEAAKIRARNERRAVRDGEITPACAQTCPTQAITFGDLGDPQSRVSKLLALARSYTTLPELKLKQRTHYLARLRNPAGTGGTHEA